MRDHPLDPIFRPRSVAVVGASATPGSVGAALMRNLLAGPFGGVVYPVNPRRAAVHGVRAYPSLADVPDAVELAVIAVPAEAVPGVVEQCAERGVRGAVVVSAGFGELHEHGRELERRARVAAAGRVRLVGPNSLGVIRPAAGLNASIAVLPRPGRVALLSQSGAVCASVLDWAAGRGVGFSAVVSVGNMADVDWADLIDYLGDDPATASILLYLETAGDARRFVSAARAVARSKPVIAVKAGRCGTHAAADAVFDAALRRAGVLRVQTVRDLFHMAEVLAMQPAAEGARLAIVTNAGGPGLMAVDDLLAGGGVLATLAPESLSELNRVLPPFWSRANPVNVLGDADPDRFGRAVAAVVRDSNVDGVVVVLCPKPGTDPLATARRLVPLARVPGKPVLAAWVGGPSVEAGRDALNAAGLPTFDTPEAAVRAFLGLSRHREALRLLYERPDALPPGPPPDAEAARATLALARSEGRTLLTEAESKALLAAYGVPVLPTRAAGSPEEAIVAADAVGYPVAVKLLSRVITHKAEANGVRLGVPDAEGVRAAFESVQAAALDYAARRGLRGDIFAGVSVQPMGPTGGVELVLASTVDPVFGPAMHLGTPADAVGERAVALPPLNRTLARRLIERSRLYSALKATRARPVSALDRLEELLVGVAQMLVEVPDIADSEIGPVVVTEGRAVVADARISLLPADRVAAAPRVAIRPYPNRLVSRFGLRDGPEVVIRPVRPEDEALVVGLFEAYSEQTVRYRFFRMLRELSRDTLVRMCHIDYDREMGLIAVGARADSSDVCIGVSRYMREPGTDGAEFALAVADAWHGRGLGRELMARLIDAARLEGVRRLVGPTLRENVPMRRLGEALGFAVTDTDDPAVLELSLDL